MAPYPTSQFLLQVLYVEINHRQQVLRNFATFFLLNERMFQKDCDAFFEVYPFISI